MKGTGLNGRDGFEGGAFGKDEDVEGKGAEGEVRGN